jgi:DNA invertase Pin-like site-specific DNA recombinase
LGLLLPHLPPQSKRLSWSSEFQRMIEAGTSRPAPFDIVIVHSFSRFFRDHFELEFYVRRLAKNGVKLVSITQGMGDDPMHVMMRRIMALFDECQSKENAISRPRRFFGDTGSGVHAAIGSL